MEERDVIAAGDAASVSGDGVASARAARQFVASLRNQERLRAVVLRVQGRLVEGRASAETMAKCAMVLRPEEYDGVVSERAARDMCGYPRCDPERSRSSARFRLSQRWKEETRNFCSARCADLSEGYRSALSEEPLYLRADVVRPRAEGPAPAAASADGNGGNGADDDDGVDGGWEVVERDVPADGGAPSAEFATGQEDVVEGYRPGTASLLRRGAPLSSVAEEAAPPAAAEPDPASMSPAELEEYLHGVAAREADRMRREEQAAKGPLPLQVPTLVIGTLPDGVGGISDDEDSGSNYGGDDDDDDDDDEKTGGVAAAAGVYMALCEWCGDDTVAYLSGAPPPALGTRPCEVPEIAQRQGMVCGRLLEQYPQVSRRVGLAGRRADHALAALSRTFWVRAAVPSLTAREWAFVLLVALRAVGLRAEPSLAPSVARDGLPRVLARLGFSPAQFDAALAMMLPSPSADG